MNPLVKQGLWRWLPGFVSLSSCLPVRHPTPGFVYLLLLLLFSHSVVSDSLWPNGCSMPGFLILHNLPEFAQTHVHWVNESTISSSINRSTSCPQSFPASGSFLMNLLFISGGQSIGALASALVLPMNTQDWFPLGWTDFILQSKRLSRVFSSTRVQKHQFLYAQPSLWSSSLTSIHDYWKNHSFD